MNDSIRNYLEDLANLHPPADLNAFLQEAAQRETHISTWQSWAIVAIMNYRQFKARALDVFTSEILPTYGHRYGATAIDFEGMVYVPRTPEWVFFACGYHEGRNGCYFANRVTGKQIHFDVTTGRDHFSSHDFVEHLIHEPNRGFAEQRLEELRYGVPDVFQELIDLGVLHDQESYDSELAEVEINAELGEYSDCLVERLNTQLSNSHDRLWITAWCGDWEAAHEAACQLGHQQLIELARARAKQSANAATTEQCIAVSDSELVYAAIGKDDPAWCPQALQLLHKNRCDLFRERCARYLAKHSFRTRDVIRELNGSKKHDLAIVLAVEHATDMLVPLLRCGLRSVHDQTRLISAAVLALFDKQWSRDELVAMLHESHDPVETKYCRAALRESRDHSMWKVAADWEVKNPLLDRESLRNERDEKILRREMTELFNDVMRIRDSFRPR